MRPYYADSLVTLYHGDCREVLPTLEVADLVLTDPPYGLGDRWSGGGCWQHHRGLYAQAKEWDQEPPDAETMAAVIAKGRNAIVWGGNYFTLPPSRCWLAWVKSPLMYTVADFELAWTSFDRPAKLFNERRNPDGRREHPTQKPLSLMAWCIRTAESPQTLIDPFAGSGTALRAAKDLGVRAVGIEVRERYCEIAAQKLSQETLELGA